MRQIAGVSAFLALAVAVARFTGGPQATQTSLSTDGKPSPSQPASHASKARTFAPYRGGCSAFLTSDASDAYPKDATRGAATSVINHFFAIEETTAKSELEIAPLRKEAYVRYAIALAPDPRHTNLSLIFDREMVSIQQAAQDEGYNYNSSWLPWKTESAAYPLYADAQRSDDETGEREACPGVLLFRKSVSSASGSPDATSNPLDAYKQALVVLVVGEQPTGGLNEDQWANAIAWLNRNASPAEGAFDKKGEQIPGPDRPLYILGPTFSGSLVSLNRDLAGFKSQRLPKSDKLTSFPSETTPVRILSGSIRGCAPIQWFQKRLADSGRAETVFGSFSENDELQIFRLLNYLDQQGTEPKDVAILSEDETAYAAAPFISDTVPSSLPAGSCEFPYARTASPVRFSYPRDISALRTAYEKEAVFSTGANRSAHPILQVSDALIEEPSNISDTIRSFSGPISPVAQEAVLYGIVSHLRAHHSGYIILRCTNSLDFLFLTRFFHRAYPEGRIVTVGADLLFRREIDTTEFRGVLALSNYPLLPRDQHWAALSTIDPGGLFPAHTHRIPDSHFEGIYLAGRYLFGEASGWPNSIADRKQPLTLPFKSNLPDFADPFWMHKPDQRLDTIQAPTWLSVVGRDGYWPLAVLNSGSTPNQCLDREPPAGSRNRCSSSASFASPAPAPTMVQLKGKREDSKAAHYDLDPAHRSRFHPSLLLKMHLAWQICVVCAVFLLCYQIFGVWCGHRFTSLGLFAPFRPGGSISQPALLGINCALAVSILLEPLTLGLTLPAFGKIFGEGRSVIPSLFLCLLCVEVIYGVMHLRKIRDKAGAKVAALSILILVLFWEFSSGFAGWPFAGDSISSFGNLFEGAGLLGIFTFIGALAACILFCCLFAGWTLQGLIAVAAFLLAVRIGGGLIVWTVHSRLNGANSLPIFYRISHLTSGASPTVPVLFLLVGFYLWTWQAMAGNSLLCYGRPLLPKLERSKSKGFGLRYYRVSQELGLRIVNVAGPFWLGNGVLVVPLFLLIASAAYLKTMGPPLLSLEGRDYDKVLNGLLLFAFLITIAEAGRLFVTWKELQRLLTALSRLRLRRTFAKLHAIESSSLWSVSGSVQRIQYHFFAQQLDAARRICLLNHNSTPGVVTAMNFGDSFSQISAQKINTGALWEDQIEAKDSLGYTRKACIREVLNEAVAEVFEDLIVRWKSETDSLSLEPLSKAQVEGSGLEESSVPDDNTDPTKKTDLPDMTLSDDRLVRTQEEFVCFHYIAFIQNILARMRTMVLSMTFLFVSVCFAISFYPFVPRTGISIWMIINLLLLSAAVVYVYAGMERDATLSYITNTTAGRLSGEFYLKTAGFLAGPLIGLLTTQFPSISESLLSWLQPGLDALK